MDIDKAIAAFGYVYRNGKEPFYSPCLCGEFEAKQSGQEVRNYYAQESGSLHYEPGTGQTVCANCGCHDPKRGDV